MKMIFTLLAFAAIVGCTPEQPKERVIYVPAMRPEHLGIDATTGKRMRTLGDMNLGPVTSRQSTSGLKALKLDPVTPHKGYSTQINLVPVVQRIDP